MSAPLADKIRPKGLDDVVGQKHLLSENRPLRRIIESGKIPNMIFYGPSGVGKTTVSKFGGLHRRTTYGRTLASGIVRERGAPSVQTPKLGGMEPRVLWLA